MKGARKIGDNNARPNAVANWFRDKLLGVFIKGEIKVPETWEQNIAVMLKEFDEELRIKHIHLILNNVNIIH